MAGFDYKAEMAAALRAAYHEQVSLLFANLCNGGDGPGPTDRFTRGLGIATRHYEAELAKLDRMD